VSRSKPRPSLTTHGSTECQTQTTSNVRALPSTVSDTPTIARSLTDSTSTTAAGLLAPLGDPLGKVLNAVVKPTVGTLTKGVGEPTGDALKSVEVQAKREKGYTDEEKPEEEWWGGKPMGGKEVTAQNPLGIGK